jgi:hypothetical protein
MAWVYLAVAGLLEIGWTLGLKIAENREPDSWRHHGCTLYGRQRSPIVAGATGHPDGNGIRRLDRNRHCRDTDCGDFPVW